MNITNYFEDIILTKEQESAALQIEDFLQGQEKVFVLNGYAGTGKTTFMKGIVKYLQANEKRFQLMAPTGRAAKVITQKTGLKATTIHKGIYSFDDLLEIKNDEKKLDSFLYQYKLYDNIDAHRTIFIIDEASMLSDIYSEGEFFRFGTGYLLKDLITYTKILGTHSSSKIIFIGDKAQLPPVGMNFSPALDLSYLENFLDKKPNSFELKEVKRQERNNLVLQGATKLRNSIESNSFTNFDLRENGSDIFTPSYDHFTDVYQKIKGKKIIICYKNKTALDFNQQIRRKRYGEDLPICKTDHVISGSNNYAKGLMNGEFAVVVEVDQLPITRQIIYNNSKGHKEYVTLSWRRVVLLVEVENSNSATIEGYLLENYLFGDNHLKSEEYKALYVDFKNRNPKIKEKTPEFKEAIKNDEFFNCFMLKYGYAITCHKAQGGEWDNVMVVWDKGRSSNYIEIDNSKSGKTNADFYRWAYTAITRTSNTLYGLNPPFFNSFSGMQFIDVEVQDALHELIGFNCNTVEIELTEKLQAELEKFNLLGAPVLMQDHFIKRWYALNPRYIDIAKFDIRGYEARYTFSREHEQCSLKYWFNAKHEFKSNFQIIPSHSNSDSFVEECINIINKSPNINVSRNTPETILPRLSYLSEVDTQKPFLVNLKEKLEKLADDFLITDVEHLSYKERYTFTRGDEIAVVDFEYNADGFFGRVLPLSKKCNSSILIERIKKTVNLIKSDYVIV